MLDSWAGGLEKGLVETRLAKSCFRQTPPDVASQLGVAPAAAH